MASAANAAPAPATLASGQAPQSTGYHPQLSPAVAALQAQAEAAVARSDGAAARELSRQVQAQLIAEQRVVSRPVQPIAVQVPAGAAGGLEADKLILAGNQSAISADYEQDSVGTMWAAVALQTDSLTWVCKSTNHGVNWSTVAGWYWPAKHAISKTKLVVGQGDSGFVYVFENVPTSNGDLLVGRINKDGTGLTGWGVRTGTDTITDFTACRDFSGGNYWLYAVAYNGSRAGNWPPAWLLRSTDYGHTWAVTDSIYNSNVPTLAFGHGTYGYYCSAPKPATWSGIVATGTTKLWSNPGTWSFHDWRPDSLRINDAAIAPAFTTPESTATVWIAYGHYVSGVDWDVLSAHTNDAIGGAWIGPDTIAHSSNPEGYVDLKNYTSAGNSYINVSYVDIDMTTFHDNAYLGWSEASTPSVWHMGGPVNQTVYSGWGFTNYPNIVYSPGGPGSGGGLVFPDLNESGTYFNAIWLTGVAEQRKTPARNADMLVVSPSIANGAVLIRWKGGANSVTVTDALGRIVRDYDHPTGENLVWNGRVAAGTYFVHLVTNRGSATKHLIIQ
jgi:hypothetical protein